MSALNITTDATGKVVKVMVDDKVIENVSDVSQNLSRGVLVATIKANFDSITVAEQAGEPAPALTVAFSAGSVTGATKATITGEAGVGNHFAYAVADSKQETPNVGAVVSGATPTEVALKFAKELKTKSPLDVTHKISLSLTSTTFKTFLWFSLVAK